MMKFFAVLIAAVLMSSTMVAQDAKPAVKATVKKEMKKEMKKHGAACPCDACKAKAAKAGCASCPDGTGCEEGMEAAAGCTDGEACKDMTTEHKKTGVKNTTRKTELKKS